MAKRSTSKPASPPVPPGYGKLLADERKKLGLNQLQVAHLAGYSDDLTVSRVEAGIRGSSMKAANAIRAALVAKGAVIPPLVLSGADENWSLPMGGAPKPMADATEEQIRRNLVRFREATGMDQFAAADVTGIPYEDLRRYELGEEPVPHPRLSTIAAKYGCRPGDFFEDKLPEFDSSKRPVIHFGGPGAANLTDLERETLRKITAAVAERMKPKRRR